MLSPNLHNIQNYCSSSTIHAKILVLEYKGFIKIVQDYILIFSDTEKDYICISTMNVRRQPIRRQSKNTHKLQRPVKVRVIKHGEIKIGKEIFKTSS